MLFQEDSDTPDNQSRQGSVTCSIDFEFGIMYAASIVVITGQLDASAEKFISSVRPVNIAMLFQVLTATHCKFAR
jgi:hypothetical protein